MHTPAENVFCCLQSEPVPTQRPPDSVSLSGEQHAVVSLHLFPAQHGLPVTPQGRQIGFKKSA